MNQYPSYKYIQKSAVYLSDVRVTLFFFFVFCLFFFLQDTGIEKPDYMGVEGR